MVLEEQPVVGAGGEEEESDDEAIDMEVPYLSLSGGFPFFDLARFLSRFDCSGFRREWKT